MEIIAYTKYRASDLTDDLWHEASTLFSKQYGVWSEEAEERTGGRKQKGARIKLSPRRLRSQVLPSDSEGNHVRVAVNGTYVGHVFACRWMHHDRTICWITQLVVHSDYRSRGLASGLLGVVRGEGDDVYGVLSSHPFTCLAVMKVLGDRMWIDEAYVAQNASSIMLTSPVPYVRDAKLHGSVFGDKTYADEIQTECCADTGFYVDHTEPLQAQDVVRSYRDWPLGDLPEGHEFLVLVEAKHKHRERERYKQLMWRENPRGPKAGVHFQQA